MTNKYWIFFLLVLSIISFADITASNEFVTAPQYGAGSHSANNQPQWVPSNAAASSSSAAASGDGHSHSDDDHSHSGDGLSHFNPSSLTIHHGRKQSLTEDTSETFVCTLCSDRFRRQEHLKRHYHSLHTQDKTFERTDFGTSTTWWIALIVIFVVILIYRIGQRRQRVNIIAHQRNALELYLRNNYEVKDELYDSTSSDELDHINDQDSNAFVPLIYRDQTIRNRTGQTSLSAAATRAIKAPAPRHQLAATFL